MYSKYIDLMILKIPSITRHAYKKSFRQNDDTNFHPYVQWVKVKIFVQNKLLNLKISYFTYFCLLFMCAKLETAVAINRH